MKKIILLVSATCFVLTLAIVGQQPDRWHGLVLGESTVSDAAKTLGTADKDEANQSMRVFGGVNRWITKRQKEKIFRVLEFKLGKEQGVQKATLYFLDDKLVRLNLDLKGGAVSPNGLSGIYGVKL